VEDDYFSAVDDLNRHDTGAGHIGESGFGSGVFYLYLCIDRALLVKNLGGDAALAATALGALAEAAATAAPRGKQNSFAAHGRAEYILAEKGDRQPRTLAGAFAEPIAGTQIMADSIAKLKKFRRDIDKAYDQKPEPDKEMQVGGEGTLTDILAFCRD
jgi:CRISPR system Cascade subunit CasC